MISRTARFIVTVLIVVSFSVGLRQLFPSLPDFLDGGLALGVMIGLFAGAVVRVMDRVWRIESE